MSIKTVGNQTFLSSKSNNIAINLAHVIKVINIEYCIYDEEGERLEEPGKGYGVLTSDERWSYFGDIKGDYRGNHNYWHNVYADSSVKEEIKEFFF